jgi:CubicO group peptidase (beta-lactamase class C family)
MTDPFPYRGLKDTMKRPLFSLAMLIFLTNGCQNYKASMVADGSFEQKKDILVQYKKHESIKGLAFAIFDGTNIIWSQCLGHTTYGSSVNDRTLFSIQSISKNFTSLAVMIAVQDGSLGLDIPISQYLPDFKPTSRFEPNPETKITLRMLLSHTAGLVHEAPVGNNYDYSPCTLEDHLKSIRRTSLKFPVGTAYSYSNCGVDIAAEILERISRMKFHDHMKSKLFDPLGMTLTTVDDSQFVANPNKTEGTVPFTSARHYQIPLIGSGAVYTSLSDFIKYVQLQMNWGNFKGNRLIDKKYLYEMYTIKFENYGLGTYIGKSNGSYYINHNGQGYGFRATMLWFPEYRIGSVLLCNKEVPNTFEICESIVKSYIRDKRLVPDQQITDSLNSINGHYFAVR